MEQDIVITHERIKDTITLEGEYTFSVYITIGLEKSTDFYVEIEFLDLTKDSTLTVARLSKLSKALLIDSELIKKEGFDITHIVVIKFEMSSLLTAAWKCTSDKPDMSLIIE